jgi:hypothetical protein
MNDCECPLYTVVALCARPACPRRIAREFPPEPSSNQLARWVVAGMRKIEQEAAQDVCTRCGLPRKICRSLSEEERRRAQEAWEVNRAAAWV